MYKRQIGRISGQVLIDVKDVCRHDFNEFKRQLNGRVSSASGHYERDSIVTIIYNLIYDLRKLGKKISTNSIALSSNAIFYRDTHP